MTCLVRACIAPITNITGPIYHLVKDDGKKVDELQKLILATFHTATVAAFFFMIIPFNYIFGHQDNLSGSFAFASQFLIHPYAASLFNAFINGGYPLVTKAIDIFAKWQLSLTKDDLGGFVRAIGFCYIAERLHPYNNHLRPYIDQKYQNWASKLAHRCCTS
jgi:hypothetical protein